MGRDRSCVRVFVATRAAPCVLCTEMPGGYTSYVEAPQVDRRLEGKVCYREGTVIHRFMICEMCHESMSSLSSLAARSTLNHPGTAPRARDPIPIYATEETKCTQKTRITGQIHMETHTRHTITTESIPIHRCPRSERVQLLHEKPSYLTVTPRTASTTYRTTPGKGLSR